MQPGMKQSGILIMIKVVVMVINMLRKVLTLAHGLAQPAVVVILVMMSLHVIQVLMVPVNTPIPVMTVMVTV